MNNTVATIDIVKVLFTYETIAIVQTKDDPSLPLLLLIRSTSGFISRDYVKESYLEADFFLKEKTNILNNKKSWYLDGYLPDGSFFSERLNEEPVRLSIEDAFPFLI